MYIAFWICVSFSLIWSYLFYFIFNLFILFIFGCVGSSLLCVGFLQLWRARVTLHCGARASHCDGFSCCGARALGTQASVVVAHGLSCSAACGIFLDQGLNPCPLHQQVDSQPLHHQGRPELPILNSKKVNLKKYLNVNNIILF